MDTAPFEEAAERVVQGLGARAALARALAMIAREHAPFPPDSGQDEDTDCESMPESTSKTTASLAATLEGPLSESPTLSTSI